MDEMLDDAFEMVEVASPILFEFYLSQPAGVEGEAEQEVNQIIDELTAAALAPAGEVPSTKPASVPAVKNGELFVCNR